MPDTIFKSQVGWKLYRIWYEAERLHESLGYQTPHERLTNGADHLTRFRPARMR